jgi:predicted DCC family thiol-disulfide oxidoreductase YuxK/protein-S-isoprenylcysteine O-methyltransferase Ste14
MPATPTKAVLASPRAWLTTLVVVGLASVLALPPLLGNATGRLDDWQFGPGALIGLTLLLLGDLLGLFALVAWLQRESASTLVVTGPYRHVRNPQVIAGAAVTLGSALLLTGPLLYVYAVLWALLADLLVRPALEAGLHARLGVPFARYRQRVRCWRPRWRGYDPAREAEETPLADERTTPPGRYVLFYDGQCRFCEAGSRRLLALARPGTIERLDFQQPGILTGFPGLTWEACLVQMLLVTPDGYVYGGFEAAVRALATRPLGKVALLYYLPGVRLFFDLLYRLLAAHRYRLMGRTIAAGGCDGGTCALHFKKG